MIYLNNAATTWPKPESVAKAVKDCIDQPPEAQHRASSPEGDVMEQCRRELAALLGIKDYQRLFFCSGATETFNRIIYGLPLEGKQVFVAESEHNSVLRPIANILGDGYKVVECDHNGLLPADEDLKRQIRSKKQATKPQEVASKTKGRVVRVKWETSESDEQTAKPTGEDFRGVLFVSHCSNVTGCVQADMRAIADIVHRNGILVAVDISQSAGCLPVDIDAWDVDIAVFTGHKALFGPAGTGGYYVKRGVPLRPVVFGGTGTDSWKLQYAAGDEISFEPGTQNMPGIAGLLAGVEYVKKRGIDNICEKIQTKMADLRYGLYKIPKVEILGWGNIWDSLKKEKEMQEMMRSALSQQYADKICKAYKWPGRLSGPLVSFNIQGMSPADVGYILQNSYGITVRTGLHCSPLIHKHFGALRGSVRVSISDFTTDEEIESLLQAVAQIAN